MGGNSRYKTTMFDKEYRVVFEATNGGKDLPIYASDKFEEAEVAYEIALANDPVRPVLLMHRARIMKRSTDQ